VKRLLCYGDSNTWGQMALGRGRLDDAKQWPNILQQRLGPEYKVIQEGVGGRVAGNCESLPWRNGKDSFEMVYYSASPVDLVIIALGTNDLKRQFGRDAAAIAKDLLWYKSAIRNFTRLSEGKDTKIMYICPANYISTEGYFETEPNTRAELIRIMQSWDEPVVLFNNLPLDSDDLHFTAAAHQTVAETMTDKVKETIG
jgi:lysophospholipase L1-like esterase